jgi:hypothetical protein
MLAALPLVLAACQPVPPGIAATSEPVLSYPGDVGVSVDYSGSTTGAYYAGDTMTKPVALHYIFYGNWSDTQRQMFLTFAKEVSGSPVFSVMQSYSDGNGNRLPNSFSSVDSVNDNYSQGKTLTNLAPVVDNAIANLGLPNDPNAVYMILTASDVNVGDGNGKFFCSNFCGFHGQDLNQTPLLRVAWVGNPQYCTNNSLNPCTLFSSVSPNGDINADSMMDSIFHEVAETLTNPNHKGWHVHTKSSTGGALSVEIGDMCEFAHQQDGQFFAVGPTELDLNYTTTNGAPANMHLGAHDYLMQPFWQNADRGGCVRRLALNRPAAQPATALDSITGDLDFNGVGDVVWRDAATGQVNGTLYDQAGNILSNTKIGSASRAFEIYGIADFDGSGSADLLWQNVDTGKLSVWLLNGTTIASDRQLVATVPANELIKAVGDFNGDGLADILFQNMSDNSARVWFNTPGMFTFASLPALSPAPGLSENFESVGSADFSGDGKAEVLWHDPAADSYQIWYFDVTNIFRLNIANTGWSSLLGIVDVDRDGQADLIGVSADKKSVVWMKMGAFGPAAPQIIAGMPLPQWRFSGGSRYGAESGFLWRNRQTGDVSRWLLDTTGHVTATKHIINGVPQSWEIVAY